MWTVNLNLPLGLSFAVRHFTADADGVSGCIVTLGGDGLAEVEPRRETELFRCLMGVGDSPPTFNKFSCWSYCSSDDIKENLTK